MWRGAQLPSRTGAQKLGQSSCVYSRGNDEIRSGQIAPAGDSGSAVAFSGHTIQAHADREFLDAPSHKRQPRNRCHRLLHTRDLRGIDFDRERNETQDVSVGFLNSVGYLVRNA